MAGRQSLERTGGWPAEAGENRRLAGRDWREQEAGWQRLDRTGAWLTETVENMLCQIRREQERTGGWLAES